MDFESAYNSSIILDGDAIFIVPRLFVYHVENSHKKEFVEVVKIQEMKIYKYIGHASYVDNYFKWN